MNKIFFIGIPLLLSCFNFFSDDLDAKIFINQTSLNKFLTAIGPMTYDGTYSEKNLGVTIPYTWYVENASISIHPDKAEFNADVNVQIGPVKRGPLTILPSPVKYPAKAKALVEIKYDENTNRILIKILKAGVEISVNILGKKIVISELDISEYYRPEFEFNGPEPVQKKVDVKMPDGKIKTFIITGKTKMTLEESRIVVSSGLDFSPAVK
jgi:hypothetical protein